MWEDEWKHDVTITGDHPKYCDADYVFGFHLYEYESVLRLTHKYCEILVLEFKCEC